MLFHSFSFSFSGFNAGVRKKRSYHQLMQKMFLLKIKFVVLKDIINLPFFHGGAWYGFFREIAREAGLSSPLHTSFPFKIEPADQGVSYYLPGDQIETGVSFPEDFLTGFLKINSFLENKQKITRRIGFFLPEETVSWISTVCRTSGNNFSLNTHPVDSTILLETTRKIKTKEQIIFSFYTPLSMYRPQFDKMNGHKMVDPEFFFVNRNPLGNIFRHFISGETEIPVIRSTAKWVDVEWGDENTRRLAGGVISMVKTDISSLKNDELSEILLNGITGIGKNTNQGLGRFEIMDFNMPEISSLDRDRTLQKNLISRIQNNNIFPFFFNQDIVSIELNNTFSMIKSPATDCRKKSNKSISFTDPAVVNSSYKDGFRYSLYVSLDKIIRRSDMVIVKNFIRVLLHNDPVCAEIEKIDSQEDLIFLANSLLKATLYDNLYRVFSSEFHIINEVDFIAVFLKSDKLLNKVLTTIRNSVSCFDLKMSNENSFFFKITPD